MSKGMCLGALRACTTGLQMPSLRCIFCKKHPTDTRRRGRRRLVRRRGSPVARGRNTDSGSVVWIASPTRPRADPVCARGVQFGRAPEGSLAPKSFPSRCFPVVRRRLGRFLRSVPRRRSALLPGVRRHQLAAAAAHLDSELGASVRLSGAGCPRRRPALESTPRSALLVGSCWARGRGGALAAPVLGVRRQDVQGGRAGLLAGARDWCTRWWRRGRGARSGGSRNKKMR